jgi:tetratricopeptide (TPR) repeat protein
MSATRGDIESRLRTEPFDWNLRCDYGNILYKEQCFQQSLEQFKLLLKQKQLLQEAHLGLARCYAKLEYFADAKHHYLEASKLEPFDPDPELESMLRPEVRRA